MVNDGEILPILQIILLKNIDIYIALSLDSCLLHNPLHTVVLHLATIVIQATIVIHLVECKSHFGISVSMARHA